jgi:hypothetical protein
MEMKKILSLMAIITFLSCNNSSDGNDALDSLEKRKDTLLENIDSASDAAVDSVKESFEKRKENFDSAFEARKDSLEEKSAPK